MQVMMTQPAVAHIPATNKQVNTNAALFSQFLSDTEQVKEGSGNGLGELLANLFSTDAEIAQFWNSETINDEEIQTLLDNLPEEVKEMIEALIKEEIEVSEAVLNPTAEMKVAVLLQALFNENHQKLTQTDKQQLSSVVEKWFPAMKLDSKDTLARQVEHIVAEVKKLMNEQGGQDRNTFLKVMEHLSTAKKVLPFAEQAYQRYVPSKQTEQQMITTSKELQNVQSPLSAVEQWTLKVPVSQSEVQSQQFVRDIQQIISRGKILVNESGFTKMQIKLTPENLGTIEIQLIQKHGEITAKIIASSQGAKEALDGQLSQLKQAFIGQNIDLEKLEVIFQGDEQSFEFHDQDQQREEQSQTEEHSKDDSENNLSFEEQLSQIVLNEKV